ncbi:MAG: triose-phosphate isomerase [Armatimonadota bacterium]
MRESDARLVVGNWKMNLTQAEARHLAAAVATALRAQSPPAEVALCPAYPLLGVVRDALRGTNVRLGAQDLFWEERGAFTGKVSGAMLRDAGCEYCIVGHSECRGRFGKSSFDAQTLEFFSDTDDTVRRKFAAALDAGLRPILCVGETAEERAQGVADGVVEEQVNGVLLGLRGDASHCAIAYEPVWAIGTGNVCDPDEAERMAGVIRGVLERRRLQSVRVLYGGSVTPENAPALFAKPGIQGALVGGASLKVEQFFNIVKAA